MNFESLKTGFFSYLEKITEKADEAKSNFKETNASLNTDISIFTHSEEFKNYVVEEVGADSSIFSKSISEIMSMDFENGQFVVPEETNADSFERENGSYLMTDLLNSALVDENVINALDYDKSGDLSVEEISKMLYGISGNEDKITFDDLAQAISEIQNNNEPKEEILAESSQNIINRLLEKIYSDPAVIKALDIFENGKLSNVEKSKFEKFITGYDGDGSGELSEADIKRAYDDILSGKFSYNQNLEEVSKEIDAKVEAELALKELINKANENNAANSINSNSFGTTSSSSLGTTTGTNSTINTTVDDNNSVDTIVSSSTGATAGSSNSFSSSNTVSSATKSYDNMSLDQLESEKTSKESEVQEARDEVSAVHSGENSAVKETEENLQEAKEAYDEAVENDKNIADELKQQREENLEAISQKESSINDLKTEINNKDAEITNQKSVIDSFKSNIASLESALSSLYSQTSDDPAVQAEIDEKKAQLEAQIAEAKNNLEEEVSKLETLENKKAELEAKLQEEEAALSELEQERSEIEAQMQENIDQESQEALEKYNEAKENVQAVKDEELQKTEEILSKAQSELDEINNQINVKEAESIQKENTVNEFDFDFEVNLSDIQEYELDAFKKNWEENKDKYEAVEEATGMPAELIAAIHWREGSGNFNTYLHNGQQLGQTTTYVPKGIYFEDWTEAAIDAVTNYGTPLSDIDPSDIQTYYDYAEHYNGMGYANKGLPSPYVWAGTDNYEKGKYVADGQFDPNYVDQQLGVAVMLKALLE